MSSYDWQKIEGRKLPFYNVDRICFNVWLLVVNGVVVGATGFMDFASQDTMDRVFDECDLDTARRCLEQFERRNDLKLQDFIQPQNEWLDRYEVI